MRDRFFRKGLVFGIIILFIGASVVVNIYLNIWENSANYKEFFTGEAEKKNPTSQGEIIFERKIW